MKGDIEYKTTVRKFIEGAIANLQSALDGHGKDELDRVVELTGEETVEVQTSLTCDGEDCDECDAFLHVVIDRTDYSKKRIKKNVEDIKV